MNAELLHGSCHCGAIKFEVRTAVTPAIRCNCSLCRRKGILMSPPFVEGNLKILRGEDSLAMYQFNTRVAKHFFCKHCGVHPFLQTPMGTDFWRVNIGCLEGIDPFTLETGLVDGASLPVMEDV
jgi:hypothetical protein